MSRAGVGPALPAGPLERKFDRIAADLRQKVQRGIYTDRVPGERDLAEQYGVHVLTANKAVTTLVEEGLLYRVRGKGTFITRLRHTRTGNLAAIVGDVLAPLHAKIVRGMESAARRTGQHLLFCNRYDDQTLEDEFASQILAQEKADGFLVWPTTLDLASPGLRRLQASAVPFVVFPHADPAVVDQASHVISDDYDGALAACRHLAGLGHRRIGFLLPEAWRAGPTPAANRHAGYCSALAAAGLEAEKPLLWPYGGSPEALAAVLRAVRGGVSALFCITDNQAIEVLRALRAEGLRVPEDISLVGFDGMPRAADFDLTTVEQPMEEIGARAVEVLLEEIEGRRAQPALVSLKGRLVVRGTTGAPRDERVCE